MAEFYARLRAAAQRLPWGLRKIVRFVELYRTALIWPTPPYTGVYHSFDDIRGVFPAARVAKDQGYFVAEPPKLDAANGMPALLDSHNLLPVVAAILDDNSGKPLRILDFGGGTGVDFRHLPYAVSLRRPLRYVVIELPELCEAGSAIWHDDQRISFRTDLPPEQDRFDIVYSSSALQFVPDPIAVLQSLARHEPKAILLTQTPMTKGTAFVRAKLEATPLPVWVLSAPEIEAAMLACGYRHAAGMSENQDYNVDRYSPEYRVPNCAVMLFLRDGM